MTMIVNMNFEGHPVPFISGIEEYYLLGDDVAHHVGQPCSEWMHLLAGHATFMIPGRHLRGLAKKEYEPDAEVLCVPRSAAIDIAHRASMAGDAFRKFLIDTCRTLPNRKAND